MNIKFLKEGVSVTSVEIKADQSTTQALVIANDSGPASANQDVTFETSALLFIDKMKGKLDATGKLALVVGPSFGARGDVQLVARCKNKTDMLKIRFV